MKSSLDPNKTKAILIGTSKFDEFNDILPVENNLTEFAKVLADENIFGLLPEKNITIIKEPTDQELKRELIQHTKSAKQENIQTLIVYFAGHGFRTREGKYYIAVKNSEKELIHFDGSTALAYDTVKKIITSSKIPQTIILIDACYSGSAAQGEGEKVFDEYRINGTYTLTSSDSTELSYYDTDAKHTIFTGELLNIFKTGLPNKEQEKISLTNLYTELRKAIKKKKPEMSPQQLASKEITGDNFLFFKNNKFDKQATTFREIKELIESGNKLYNELDFTNAEISYTRTKSKIETEKINIDKETIKQLNNSIADCRKIIKYEKIFNIRYDEIYKEKINNLQQEIADKDDTINKSNNEIDELKQKITKKDELANQKETEITDYKSKIGTQQNLTTLQIKTIENIYKKSTKKYLYFAIINLIIILGIPLYILLYKNSEIIKKMPSSESISFAIGQTYQKLDYLKKQYEEKQYYIGDKHAGGIVFYVDSTGKHGLVCADYEQNNNVKNYYSDKQDINTKNDIGTGLENTKKLIEPSERRKTPAKICYNLNLYGYDDWFLPSFNELKLMKDLHKQGIGNFKFSSYYSSSVEKEIYSFKSMEIFFPQLSNEDNISIPQIRAVRAF